MDPVVSARDLASDRGDLPLFPIWLWTVTAVMSCVPFLVVLFLLTTQDRRITALSRRLHHLERAVKQREEHGEHATKKIHRGSHNGAGTL
jgi:hypothetical protein